MAQKFKSSTGEIVEASQFIADDPETFDIFGYEVKDPILFSFNEEDEVYYRWKGSPTATFIVVSSDWIVKRDRGYALLSNGKFNERFKIL